MRTLPTPCPRTARFGALLLVSALAGCEPGSGASGGLAPEPESSQSLGWVGTFRGSGAGTAGAAAVEWNDVALRIGEAPDSLTDESCDPCLVLSLDTLFQAMHVRAPSDVELVVTRDEGDERQTLQLLRYSGGGSTGNVVDATLRIERGSATTLEARFLLDR